MQDITARIVVTAEAAGAKQGLSDVKNGLNEITDSRMKDLKIAQSSARLELAEYNSMIAAQKAYNAEIELTGAKRRLAFRKENGAGAKEIEELSAAVETLQGKYLPLANAEASANLAAYQAKKSHDALLASFDGVGKAAGKTTAKTSLLAVGARALGKIFHADLGGGTENFKASVFQLGIIGAGAAAGLKLLNVAVTEYYARQRDGIDVSHQNASSIQEAAERNKKYASSQQETVSALLRLNETGEMSNQSMLEQSRLLKELGVDYSKLGITIDSTTGKLQNAEIGFAKLAERQKKQQMSAIDAELKQLENERKQLQSNIANTSWFDALITGGKANEQVQKDAKRIDDIVKRFAKLKEERRKLASQDPVADAEKKQEAIYNDAQEKMEERLGNIHKEIEMQNLLAKGKEREVEIMKIRNKLDEERKKLSGSALTAFDEQRANLEEALIMKYDNKQKNRREKTTREQSRSILGMLSELGKFRQIGQTSVDANSMEAVRLQSRRLMNGPLNADPQKESSRSLKELLKKQAEEKKVFDQMLAALLKIAGAKTGTTPVKIF